MMKTLLLLILLFVTTPIIAMEKDKQLHFQVSFASTLLSSYFCERVFEDLDDIEQNACGAMATFGAGLAKEILDSFEEKNIFSTQDIVANMNGIVAGSLAYQTLTSASDSDIFVPYASSLAGSVYCDHFSDSSKGFSVNTCALLSGVSAMTLTKLFEQENQTEDQKYVVDGLIGILAASMTYKISNGYISGWFDDGSTGVRVTYHFD
ncbi:hypothetical protein CS022_23760 [Veronia nyctiphanis]|uniref:Uncharacterized protein n=1 Tax=Veronia nyctiphanis TaxID=1278244 RepID=A0A4Q0YKC2_9GAMM|nr:hypothetical protein [Veronia nyctiphanis]RXJ69461.1 hypothetical protein CS022_23760 [Veronia nyctiphanis]